MHRFTVIASLALLGLVACSSESSSSATTAASVAVTEATTPVDASSVDDTTPDDTTPDDTLPDVTLPDVTLPDDTGAVGVGSEFCEINDELSEGGVAMDGTDTPGSLENYFTVDFPAQLSRLEGVTPPELAADVETLIEGVTQLGTVLEANAWDVAAAFADPALEAIANNEAFAEAGTRVDAYCGV